MDSGKCNDKECDDLDLTDTSASSSSTSHGGMFEAAHQPFVLELHDIRKDDPLPSDVAATKIKRHRKKKKGIPLRDASRSSVSSDSLSEGSSLAPSATDTREEFYDAHESYHAMPENQEVVARLQAQSDHSHSTAKTAGSEQTTTTTSSMRRDPHTIAKPNQPSK